ncbi:MAG: ABC transporter permease [Pseudomonadota bacterium]
MFSYYFLLGARSLRRNRALTALMILTLAVGVAASVATLTILRVMASDPIPQKSDRLFVPEIDVGPLEGYNPAERNYANSLLTYKDAITLLKNGPGERRMAMYSTSVTIEPAQKDLGVLESEGLAPTREFFNMFDVPFRYGQAWSADDEARGAKVVVLSHSLSEKLYGTVNPVGQRLTMAGHPFQIVGVLEAWAPVPKFYRLIGGPGAFSKEEEFVIPLASAIALKSGVEGSMSCNTHREPGFQGLLDSECTWIQFFFETSSAAGRADVQNYLDNYTAEQRKLGRILRHAKNEVYDVMDWLRYRKVVANDNRLATWLAFAFLLLCLVNTIGLLLAKFSVRAAEVGIRRALGASRRALFHQFLVESAVVGLAGGVLGLLLALAALALIGTQSEQLSIVAHMDWLMLGLTFVMALLAAILAGLLPTWRACQVTPALQLKSQ